MTSASDRTNVEELPWTDLLDKIRQGECVPFIGAGASYPVLPRATELAEDLLKDDQQETGNKSPLTARTDHARVCQYLAVSHSDSGWPKQRIAAKIQKVPPPDFNDPSEPHRALANLKLPTYITTNYDDFMFRALKSAGASP